MDKRGGYKILKRGLWMGPKYAALDGHIGESLSHFELGTLTYFLSVAFAINRTPMSSNLLLLLLLHLRQWRRRLDPSSQTPSSFHSTPDRIFAKRTQSSQHHFDAFTVFEGYITKCHDLGLCLEVHRGCHRWSISGGRRHARTVTPE